MFVNIRRRLEAAKIVLKNSRVKFLPVSIVQQFCATLHHRMSQILLTGQSSRPKYMYFNSLNAKLPSYRNQSNDLEDKSIDWFLYDNFEVRVKQFCAQLHYRYFFKTFSTVSNSLLQGTVEIPIPLKIKHLGPFLISFRQAIFGTYRNRFNHKQK